MISFEEYIKSFARFTINSPSPDELEKLYLKYENERIREKEYNNKRCKEYYKENKEK
jgi:hypothetical protein